MKLLNFRKPQPNEQPEPQFTPVFSSSWKIVKGKKPKPLLTDKQTKNIIKVWAEISTEAMGSVY